MKPHSAESNYNRTFSNEVLESDSESEYNRAIENRDKCSRSPPTEPSAAEKPETVDQMLSNAGPALINLPIAQLRTLAFDMLFAFVPDPQSVSLIHSLLPLGVDQLSPEEVRIVKLL